MNSLETQIRELARLADETMPWVDPREVQNPSGVRELSPPVPVRSVSSKWIAVAGAAALVLLLVGLPLWLSRNDTPPTDTTVPPVTSTTTTVPDATAWEFQWKAITLNDAPKSWSVLGRLASGDFIASESLGSLPNRRCWQGEPSFVNVPCDPENVPEGAVLLSDTPTFSIISEDGSVDTVSLEGVAVAHENYVRDGWLAVVAGNGSEESFFDSVWITNDGRNWDRRALPESLDGRPLDWLGHGYGHGDFVVRGDVVVVWGGNAPVLASRGPGQPFEVVLDGYGDPFVSDLQFWGTTVYRIGETLHAIRWDNTTWRSSNGFDWEPTGEAVGIPPLSGPDSTSVVASDRSIGSLDGTAYMLQRGVDVEFYSSTDGVTWVEQPAPPHQEFGNVELSQPQLDGWLTVMDLDGGKLAMTADGASWHVSPPNPSSRSLSTRPHVLDGLTLWMLEAVPVEKTATTTTTAPAPEAAWEFEWRQIALDDDARSWLVLGQLASGDFIAIVHTGAQAPRRCWRGEPSFENFECNPDSPPDDAVLLPPEPTFSIISEDGSVDWVSLEGVTVSHENFVRDGWLAVVAGNEVEGSYFDSIWLTDDGRNWDRRALPVDGRDLGHMYGHGDFLVHGDVVIVWGGNAPVLASPGPGQPFVEVIEGDGDYEGPLPWGATVFRTDTTIKAITPDLRVWESGDGLVWTSVGDAAGLPNLNTSVPRFVEVVGGTVYLLYQDISPLLLSSTDGRTWVEREAPPHRALGNVELSQSQLDGWLTVVDPGEGLALTRDGDVWYVSPPNPLGAEFGLYHYGLDGFTLWVLEASSSGS